MRLERGGAPQVLRQESSDCLSDTLRLRHESLQASHEHTVISLRTLVSRGCSHLCNPTATPALFRWHGGRRWTSESVMWRSRVQPCNRVGKEEVLKQ